MRHGLHTISPVMEAKGRAWAEPGPSGSAIAREALERYVAICDYDDHHRESRLNTECDMAHRAASYSLWTTEATHDTDMGMRRPSKAGEGASRHNGRGVSAKVEDIGDMDESLVKVMGRGDGMAPGVGEGG